MTKERAWLFESSTKKFCVLAAASAFVWFPPFCASRPAATSCVRCGGEGRVRTLWWCVWGLKCGQREAKEAWRRAQESLMMTASRLRKFHGQPPSHPTDPPPPVCVYASASHVHHPIVSHMHRSLVQVRHKQGLPFWKQPTYDARRSVGNVLFCCGSKSLRPLSLVSCPRAAPPPLHPPPSPPCRYVRNRSSPSPRR